MGCLLHLWIWVANADFYTDADSARLCIIIPRRPRKCRYYNPLGWSLLTKTRLITARLELAP